MTELMVKCKHCEKTIAKKIDSESWLAGAKEIATYIRLTWHNIRRHPDKNSPLKVICCSLLPLYAEMAWYLVKVALTAICWPFVLLANRLDITCIDI